MSKTFNSTENRVVRSDPTHPQPISTRPLNNSSTACNGIRELEASGDRSPHPPVQGILFGTATVWLFSAMHLAYAARTEPLLGVAVGGASLVLVAIASSTRHNDSRASNSTAETASGIIALLILGYFLVFSIQPTAIVLCLTSTVLLSCLRQSRLLSSSFLLIIVIAISGYINVLTTQGVALALSIAACFVLLRSRHRLLANWTKKSLIRLGFENRELREELAGVTARLKRSMTTVDPTTALELRGELDGLWEWNFTTDEIYVSPRWREILGYAGGPVIMDANEWLNLIHPYDLSEFLKRLSGHLQSESEYFECEHRVRQADGAYRWVLSTGKAIRDSEGQAERMAGSQVDIKRLKTYEDELEKQATHDRLTGLPNREFLLESLKQSCDLQKVRANYSFALVFVDLDHFKVINDTLGHLAGDKLLMENSRRVVAACEAFDSVVARFGGDEFVILLRQVDRETAMGIGNRIVTGIHQEIKIDGHDVTPSASLGISMSSDGDGSPDSLLRQADLAMYRAKAKGKGRVELFEVAMEHEAAKAFSLGNDLRRALDRNEFVLFYQPIVCLSSGIIESVEALIRWNRPDVGIVEPGEFIPFAEESDLIVKIGEWVSSGLSSRKF